MTAPACKEPTVLQVRKDGHLETQLAPENWWSAAQTGSSSVVGVGRAWCRASSPTRQALGEGLREPQGPELSIGTRPERDQRLQASATKAKGADSS